MAVSDPEKLIWYVRAELASGDVSEGSAVAIRLQEIVTGDDGSRKGDPNTARTYLLTCAHVLRERSSDNKEGFGRVVSEEKIRVWMPSTGSGDDQARKVRVQTDVRRLDTNEVPRENRSNPVDDWVVLEIVDRQTAMAAPGLYEGDIVDAAPSSGTFRIDGYPGGERSLPDGIVTPTTVSPFPFRDHYLGLLRLTGTETAAGMSGGGVFQVDDTEVNGATTPLYRFAGLHRARDYQTLQLHAVSATTILDHIQLESVPFELVRRRDRPLPPIPTPPEPTPAGPTPPGPLPPGPTPAGPLLSKAFQLVLAVVLVVVLVVAALILWPRDADPTIQQRMLADPGSIGEIEPAVLSELHRKYQSRVYVMLTEPFRRSVTSPRFLVYSPEADDTLEIRGVVEDATSGSARGRLLVDPAGSASETVRIELADKRIQKGERLRLLLGVRRNVAPAEADDQRFLQTIKLERAR